MSEPSSSHPGRVARPSAACRRVAVVTGSRAEFGLLETVMRAIDGGDGLELLTIVAGAHLLEPAGTWREVADRWPIAAKVPMQQPGDRSRLDDAAALGRGAHEFAHVFAQLEPDWVVVLGDRIEAFAAAAAASVGGVALAHIHGGDRAEGVADEAMRHAITKLAHLHLPATEQSAQRIVRMGEEASRVHVVGSPAIDDLARIEPIGDDRWREWGEPEIILLLHPIGRSAELEQAGASGVIEALAGRRVLVLRPNSDPGWQGIAGALQAAQDRGDLACLLAHLPRHEFVGALKRLRSAGGALVGNSSAGLIEAAALRLAVVDIGPRQRGRERPANVIHIDSSAPDSVRGALTMAQSLDMSGLSHPYGDGQTGRQIADLLRSIDPSAAGFTRKRCVY